MDFMHSDPDILSESDESDEEDEDDMVFDQINCDTSACFDNNADDESGGNAPPGGVNVDITALLKLPEVNHVAVDSDRPAEMQKIRNFHCGCQEGRKENSDIQPLSCSQRLDPDMICDTRMEMAALSKEQKDMVVMGIIKTCMNDSEMTQRAKQINGKRKINRSYGHGWHDN